ncbi:Nicotinamide/nicotinic acid mononucleotide adenylyltransferase 1, partial [Dimargaris cristalligena]
MTAVQEFPEGHSTQILSHTAPSGLSRNNSPESFVITTLTATTTVTNLPSSQPYQFPVHRLPTHMQDESKTPLVLVACGSFSPVTYLHLRMF